ncbi:unnamed protein product [Candida verbasci]|uniref:F-actin-capping protein subunit alpha n=1 Tax=Candida verbasci TaxID=1227364 RepID=A0A9W4TRV4_9ASCO|nr:unnamed protein product [Candida verbasci]
MSIKLSKLVDSLIESSPPVELKEVSNLINKLTNDQSIIDDSILSFIEENGIIYQDYIISNLNKDKQSSKYIDYIRKQLFNVDFKQGKIIDLEDYAPNQQYPDYFDDLVDKLEQYGQDYYPSTFASTIIPNEDSIHVILIGQRSNNANFYTGQWNSKYTIKSNGEISGKIKLDIHYFEDGNVRLKFNEGVTGSIDNLTSSNILNFINNQESKIILKLIENFNNLNQQQFKNLRRLLPVTRSNINWGNAIGNYRLGSDVVNKK